jgi:hypothetical protein
MYLIPKGKIFPLYHVSLRNFLPMPLIPRRTGVAPDDYCLPSYKNICIHLNLDADYFRRGLLVQPIKQESKDWETHLQSGRLTRRRT